MSVLNQIILGVLLMVTLVVVALMVRVYQRSGSIEQKQTEQDTPPSEHEPDSDEG
ncbi:MAG: hypothetical protein NWF07_07935 [Candidatus Bathyarchaeota archaeon]|nr:hypothetical protein [Candidatus Bathyarchaeota archaeon]